MGLVMEGKEYAILTDIAGAEDHYGDMDFKVAGTREGITGLQMDIKVPNVTTAIMKEALEQARRGRLFILDKMYEAMPQPSAAISQYAPRIYTLHIPTDKIRDVIGPGGKVIRGIIEQTGVKIDVEDDGTIHVASADEASANKAIQIISDLTASAEIGKTYLGKVVRLVDFGAFVEIFPGTDGLLHISEIAENRIRDVRDELKEGDQILVKVLALEGNKIKLSRKAVLERAAREIEADHQSSKFRTASLYESRPRPKGPGGFSLFPALKSHRQSADRCCMKRVIALLFCGRHGRGQGGRPDGRTRRFPDLHLSGQQHHVPPGCRR